MALEVKDPTAPASAKQVGYIMNLAVKAGVAIELFDAMFGVTNPAELNKGEASMVIEQLKARISEDGPDEDVAGDWASSPAAAMAEDSSEKAVTRTSPVTMPPRPGGMGAGKSVPSPHGPTYGRRTSPKPLPDTAPTTEGLYRTGGPGESIYYSVRKSSAGNWYADRLVKYVGGWEWDYVGQTPIRDKSVTASHKCSKSEFTSFMSVYGVCPGCKKDVTGSIMAHACKHLKKWGVR